MAFTVDRQGVAEPCLPYILMIEPHWSALGHRTQV